MEAEQAHRTAISIVETRANGTVEDLGVVAYQDPDPDVQAQVEAKIARGERVDESDVIVPGSIRFGGPAVKE